MSEKKRILLLLTFVAVALSVLAFLSEGSGYGGGDSIQHFQISKYSWKHPELFLHLWGKPFFTLVSSPFSQFGFLGINIFNIVCACCTGWLAYRIASEWQIKNAWSSVFILLFAPIYFVTIISGLTEIFFGFVLMLSIRLFQKEKYLLAAMVVSFLPFVRSEGYLILPLFAILLLTKRKFIPLLLLSSGTILYSIAGGFYYHDFLWLAHQNPYTQNGFHYGHGALTFFLSQNEFILGTILVALFVLGVVALIFKKEKAASTELVLGFGSFAIYFVAHSIFWWKGIFASDGLIRVLAAITPMATFTCMHGFNFLLSLFQKKLVLQKILSVVILILIVWMPFKQHRFPRRMDYSEATVSEATSWIKNNSLDKQKIFSSHPLTNFLLEKDPYDSSASTDFFSINHQNVSEGITQGSIVVWDAHFSPNEGGIPIQKFFGDKNFKMLNSFNSGSLPRPKNALSFEVFIFQKI